jgi:hypothetical protein
MTEDSHWMAKGTEPVAPFPKRSYFMPIIGYLFQMNRLFILKSREMMTSWLICGFVAWMAQWFPHTFWIMQSQKEDKAAELVNYCRILYRNQPQWMSERNPISVDNEMELKLQKGGRILGLPGGADQVRMHHPYGYVMDEAAFMPDAEACYNAVLPVTKQIIGVSTDNIGWYHNQCKM